MRFFKDLLNDLLRSIPEAALSIAVTILFFVGFSVMSGAMSLLFNLPLIKEAVFILLFVLPFLSFLLGRFALWTNNVFSRLQFLLISIMPIHLVVLMPLRLSANRWKDRLCNGNSFQQAALLIQSTHKTVGLSVADFLRLMEGCEADIKKDPASTVYWKKRHDLEESLKQK